MDSPLAEGIHCLSIAVQSGQHFPNLGASVSLDLIGILAKYLLEAIQTKTATILPTAKGYYSPTWFVLRLEAGLMRFLFQNKGTVLDLKTRNYHKAK